MNPIQITIKESISDAHKEAEQVTEKARGCIHEAVHLRVKVASLVEKAQRMHKQDIKAFLSEVMSGDDVSAYLTLHKVAQRRSTLEDKNQLQLCGILDRQESTMRDATPKASQSTFIGVTSRFIAKVNKTLKSRPVEQWGETEREQFADVVKPLVELYNQMRG